ncbi:MAG: VCBS repeat-containing protein [Ruminococcaceae bacterium]|nr:VCBS repeat-containing protein [Oscillospiraceae bacterium]
MGRRLKEIGLLMVTAALVMLLAGCRMEGSVEDLFTLPEIPLAYEGLSEQINNLISKGYEYAAPTGGEYIQTVQMVDFNGDGDREAVTFFREASSEKQLKVAVFQQHDGAYEQMCLIESSGTAIDSVDYRDFDGDGSLELVVGWRISAEVRTVAVYRISREPETLLQRGYTRFAIGDMDVDSNPDLIVFRAGEEDKSVAELFIWKPQEQVAGKVTALTITMGELSQGSIVLGQVQENVPALFVTGINTQNQAVTDILYCRSGSLVNAVLNSATGISRMVAPYAQLAPQDINGDGLIEIPVPQQIVIRPAVEAQTEDEEAQPAVMQLTGLITWRQYDAAGKGRDVSRTYHATSEGWYLMLEEGWKQVSTVVIDGGSYERQVILLLDGQPVVNLYTITGENRESRAMRGQRFVLKRQTATIYAAELNEKAEAYGITDALIRSNFHLMITHW